MCPEGTQIQSIFSKPLLRFLAQKLHIFICTYSYIPIYLSIYLPAYLICISIYHVSIYPSIYLSVCMCLYLSLSLSLSFSGILGYLCLASRPFGFSSMGGVGKIQSRVVEKVDTVLSPGLLIQLQPYVQPHLTWTSTSRR